MSWKANLVQIWLEMEAHPYSTGEKSLGCYIRFYSSRTINKGSNGICNSIKTYSSTVFIVLTGELTATLWRLYVVSALGVDQTVRKK